MNNGKEYCSHIEGIFTEEGLEIPEKQPAFKGFAPVADYTMSGEPTKKPEIATIEDVNRAIGRLVESLGKRFREQAETRGYVDYKSLEGEFRSEWENWK